MSKHRAITYFLLNGTSLIANSAFLYYVGLLLLQSQNGGILCGCILGMDAFFEIMVGPTLAKYVDVIPDLKSRFRYSLILQCSLVPTILIFALIKPEHPLAVILLLAAIRFFALIDNQLQSALPLWLDKQGILPLVHSLVLNRLSQRCILLLSSPIAIFFLGTSWFFSCSLNSLIYILAILAGFIIFKMISSKELEKKETYSAVGASRIQPYYSKEKKKWVLWNCAYVFLSGISFGSVVLILTKHMLLAHDQPLFLQILAGSLPIYSGVFLALAFMMICPEKINLYIRSGKQLCIVSFSLGIGLILSAMSPLYLRLIVMFFLGIVNGIGLVNFDVFFQRKIEGESFVKAVAKNQAWGKAGILLSMALMGFYIDLQFDPLHLLALCGCLGLFFSIILFTYASKLEKNSQKQALLT